VEEGHPIKRSHGESPYGPFDVLTDKGNDHYTTAWKGTTTPNLLKGC